MFTYFKNLFGKRVPTETIPTPDNFAAYAAYHCRHLDEAEQESTVDYRIGMALQVQNAERLDDTVVTREQYIEYVLRTGQHLCSFEWECPDACGFTHGKRREKSQSYLHNAPTCTCGALMRTEATQAGRIMSDRAASALWRERNWGSADATGPAPRKREYRFVA